MGEQTFNISDDNLEQHIVTLFEKLDSLRRDANTNDTGLTGRVPARLELRTLSLWKAVVAECAASFLYVFIVCGAAGGAGVGASASAVLLSTALASGCAIATLTLCFAHISGAHVNPAVSAALCVRRRVSPLRAALYVAAQCGGAIAGAAAIYGVSVPGYAGGLSASLPGGGGAAWERLGAELLLSGLVAAAYFAAMERRWTGTAPALLGAAYCAASFVSMPSLNPARSLGPSFVLSRWDSHWVCWVGGLGGGIASALLHEWASRKPRANTNSRASSPRDLDELDKPAFPSHHYRHASTYCSATAPRPDNTEPLYSGTKSLYCRSPPPARHTLHRSQSVYSKSSATGGVSALAGAQSLLLRPHTAVSQNAHNAQCDPPYGAANGVRPGREETAGHTTHSLQCAIGTSHYHSMKSIYEHNCRRCSENIFLIENPQAQLYKNDENLYTVRARVAGRFPPKTVRTAATRRNTRRTRNTRNTRSTRRTRSRTRNTRATSARRCTRRNITSGAPRSTILRCFLTFSVV